MEAIEFAEFEMRYEPRRVYLSLWRLGSAYFSMGKMEEAAKYFERSLDHNPEFNHVLAWLAATYAHLGRSQEARVALKNYLEIESCHSNLRALMQSFPFKDLKVADRFAQGLLKAGLPGEPSGYYKILEENRLSGEEIKELYFGRKITGLLWGKQLWIDYTEDGEITYRDSEFSDRGTCWIEGDKLFHKWKNSLEGLNVCIFVYRNPEGSPEKENEYLHVTVLGIAHRSLVD